MAADPPAPAPRPAAPRGPQRPASLWAIGSLLCGLGLFCPPGLLIAPLLGVRALVEIRARPELGGRGRRLALAGIILGVVGTAAWGGAAAWWHVNARRPMIDGPAAALAAGFAGDIPAFQGSFHVIGPQPGDLEAAAFIANLRQRYGRFIQSSQAPAPAVEGPPPPAGADADALAPAAPAGRSSRRIRYRLVFENAEVDAEAEFILVAEDAPGLVLRFGWIHVHDQQLGTLAYPSTDG